MAEQRPQRNPGTRDYFDRAAAVIPQFTVLNYDRRGRGDSGDTAPYAVEREIEDLAAMIAEAGFARVEYTNFTGGVAALHSGRAI